MAKWSVFEIYLIPCSSHTAKRSWPGNSVFLWCLKAFVWKRHSPTQIQNYEYFIKHPPSLNTCTNFNPTLCPNLSWISLLGEKKSHKKLFFFFSPPLPIPTCPYTRSPIMIFFLSAPFLYSKGHDVHPFQRMLIQSPWKAAAVFLWRQNWSKP